MGRQAFRISQTPQIDTQECQCDFALLRVGEQGAPVSLAERERAAFPERYARKIFYKQDYR